MNRREIIALLGAAAAWPLAARAQQGDRVRRIGVLLAAADDPVYQTQFGAFLQALGQSGWIIGQNVGIDTRSGTTNAAEVRRHAAELVALTPDIILVGGGTAAGVLQQETRTVPIVFVLTSDPVGEGLIASLAHPGGNVTGLSNQQPDLVGKRLNQPLWRLWGLDPARAPRSSFTIGLDTPEKIREKVREASSYPILKIKLGTDRDEAILRTVRDATDKPLRVDANAGWTRDRALAMLPVLKEYGVEFVEQPLPPDDLEGMAAVRRRGILPVVVDESCIVASDIPRLAGAVDGVNIKLAKCGSLREALRMIATARAHGMLVMVGCMIETSLGITAAAHFTPLVDAADLDGAALTVNDPFTGATIDGGQIRLPTGPGLGVRRR